jgi:hypothetical protein
MKISLFFFFSIMIANLAIARDLPEILKDKKLKIELFYYSEF